MVSIKQQKDYIIPKINEFLKPHDFQYINDIDHIFIKDFGDRILKFNFYFSESGLSGNSLYMITFKAVEEIILEVGLPNHKTISNERELINYSTIYDRESLYAFTDRPLKIGTDAMYERKRITTQKHLSEWLITFKNYFDFGGSNFEKNHSTILKVNSRIKDLRKIGEKNFGKLLLGGIDHLFRALIIFRLCNDPCFDQEELNFDKLILKDKYSIWHPHYIKLKQILRDTQPLYNI